MKRLLLFFLCLPALLPAQNLNTTTGSGPGNIYSDAIGRYIEYRYGTTQKKDTFFVLNQKNVPIPPLADSFGREIKGRTIIVLHDDKDLDSLLIRRAAMIHRVSSLEFHNGEFYIMITPYSSRKKEGQNQMGTWGGIAVYYTYSKRSKTFRFRKVASHEI